jgi:hypothetical protein
MSSGTTCNQTHSLKKPQSEQSRAPAARQCRAARRPAHFTKGDLLRAIKAVLAAGLQIASVRIEPDGAILVIPGTPPPVP